MSNPFATEAALCAAFLECIPKEWVAYPESCGFDIVLAHRETGAQIGIEAKLVLNTKVLCQAVKDRARYAVGPDYRAVLVGKTVAETAELADHLGLTVLTVKPRERHVWRGGVNSSENWYSSPALPEPAKYRTDASTWWTSEAWQDEAPSSRLSLPEYVPQVAAGVPAPNKLTDWTIKAIKLCILVERCGTVTRAHFQALKISPTRWCDGLWLAQAQRGHWKAGPRFPVDRFRREHPSVAAQIEADWPVWGAPLVSISGTQGALSLG